VPDKTAPRPPQVTIAAWLVMVGSVFVVLTAFDQIAGLHTMETREAVEDFLSQGGAGDTLGLDVQGTLGVLRVVTMVAAACATAAAILGYHVLRRSRSARLVLSLLAVPLFLAGFTVGGLVPAMVVGAITMLWFQPARDWLDGKTPRTAPRPPEATPPVPPLPTAAPVQPPPSPWTAPPEGPTPADPQQPRPVAGFGEQPSAPLWSAPPTAPAPPSRRPPALVWACSLTWAGAGLTFVTMMISVALMLATPDLVLYELYRQDPSLASDGPSADTLRTTVVVVGIVLVLWSVGAGLLAGLAWVRKRWAWTALVASSSTAALLCLVGTVGNPLLVIWFGLCAAAVILLLRPEVRAYFR
jgi:hypothetical protein